MPADALRRRISAAALAAGLLTILIAGMTIAPVRAESGAQLTVRVIDQTSKRGLALARVILTGPVQRLGFTDDNGSIAFTDLRSGVYRLVAAAAGYQSQTSSITVAPDAAVSAVAGLAAAGALKTIGRVSVREKRSLEVADFGSDGAIRRTHDSLDDALRFDPAASVGPNGALAIAGQPTTSAGVTLDGIPLAQSGLDLRRLGADLFSSLSVTPGPANGAIAGNVDLRPFDPTLLFRSALTTQYASDGSNRFATVLSGTSGNVGYALSAARSLTSGPLDGQRFFDASGSDFVHADRTWSDGMLAKLRLGLTPSSNLMFTALHTTTRATESCALLNDTLPCTYGPGASQTSSLDVAGLTFTGVYGKLSLTATPYVNRRREDLAYPNQIEAGLAAPQSGSVEASAAGARFAADLVGSNAVDYHLSGLVSRSSLVSQAVAVDSNLDWQADHTYDDIAVGASAKLRPGLTIAPNLRFTQTDATPHLGADVTVHWKPARDDAVNLAYVPRAYGLANTIPQAFSAPSALDFDCADHTAIAHAAGVSADEPATSVLRVNWTHEHRATKTVVSAFRTKQVNAVVPTFVNLTGLATNLIPAGFLGAANAAFTSPFACPGAPPLSASDIAVAEPAVLPAQTTLGASIGEAFQLNSSLVVIPSYSATYARADQVGPQFAVPRSVVTAGQQLPGVPMHQWSLLADYKRPGSRLEAIASVTHTAANNAYFLPAYTLIGAGLSLPLGAADLLISGTNLTNAFGGAFASPALGVPLAVNRGAPLAVPGYPLPGRRIAVAVRFAVGSSALRAGETIAPLTTPADDGTVRRFDLYSLPQTQPSTPGVDVDPAAPSCVPESLRDARRILHAIGAYTARLAVADRRAAGPFPHIDGVTMTRHDLGDSYELRFTMDPRATLAVARCGAFTYANRDQATQVGLEDRFDLASWQLDFRYARQFGLFLVERPESVVAHAVRSALPAAPPSDPFATVTGAQCRPDQTPVARALLTRLRAGIESTQASDPAFTIARHAAGAESWYSVELHDPLLVQPLLNCAAVASASRDELRRRGIDGAALPAVNYAQRVGWYVVAHPTAGEGQ
ncbi:MAG: carboxypeptidase regulatory-like domain-containing protein [Candidatus Velthaea sp.]